MSDFQIRLDSFLKFEGLAETGGHAKLMIQDGAIRVNGEVETRRTRKLCEGDIVETPEQRIEVREPEEL